MAENDGKRSDGGKLSAMGWSRSNRGGVKQYLDPLGIWNTSDYPKRGPSEETLFRQGKSMEREAQGFSSGAHARISDIMDTRDEQQRAARVASADTWQAAAGDTGFDASRPGAVGLARALAAASARGKIFSMGRNAVETQALRDRVGMMKTGMGIRTGTLRDLSAMVANQDMLTAAQMQADQTRSNAWMGLAGSVAGGAARVGQNWWANRKPPTSTTGNATRTVGTGPP